MRLKNKQYHGPKNSYLIEQGGFLVVQQHNSQSDYNSNEIRIKYKHTNIECETNYKYTNRLKQLHSN